MIIFDDTIFAFIYPAMPAGRTILRISGKDSLNFIKNIFLPENTAYAYVESKRTNTVLPGYIKLEEDLLLKGYCWLFFAPKSYTGQDMAELHLISSPILVKIIENKAIKAGLRPAERGEFTARRYFNNKIDLIQAQAINMLICAEDDFQITSAINLLDGPLHNILRECEEILYDLAIKVEANIDFSEEDIELITLQEVKKRLKEIERKLTEFLSCTTQYTSDLKEIPTVSIIGPANAGKSSLFNALIGLDRSLCSPIGGTTRDTIKAIWRYRSAEAYLIDTAGLIEEKKLKSLKEKEGKITRESIKKTIDIVNNSDLIIEVLDGTEDLQKQLELIKKSPIKDPMPNTIIAINKIDLLKASHIEELKEKISKLDLGSQDSFFISAEKKLGIESLTKAMFERLLEKTSTLDTKIYIDLRSYHALKETLDAVQDTLKAIDQLMDKETLLGLEVVAAGIRRALDAIETVLGKNPTDTTLSGIFSSFCIGK